MNSPVLARRPRSRLPGRRLLLALAALPVLLPLLWLAAAWLQPQAAGWTHLGRHVLPRALLETALLLLGTTLGCAVLGTGFGLLLARCRFPGQGWLQWALLLPAALPTYVLAFAWVGMSEFAAPLPSWVRATFGLVLPTVHGVGGAILVLTLAFYPYVYLLARQHFEREPADLLDAARVLSLSRRERLLRIRLPLALPAVLLGSSLVAMETLAEFGAVATLGVSTLTTTVYRTWYGQFNLPLAAQLASLGVVFLLLLALYEGRLRQRQRGADRGRTLAPLLLQGGRGWLACTACLLLLALALAAPLLQLLWWARSANTTAWGATWTAAWHTLLLCGTAALLVALAGLLVALAERRQRQDPWLGRLATLATAGYAIPGTILAVALLLLLTPLEQRSGWTLASGTVALLLAYLARFLRMGYAPFASRLASLPASVPEAARTLGLSRLERGRWLYWRWLRGAGLGALLLVVTELGKELPATLMLRPLEWDTLAIRVWTYTSEGLWAEAAVPALLIVALSVVPAAWLLRSAKS